MVSIVTQGTSLSGPSNARYGAVIIRSTIACCLYVKVIKIVKTCASRAARGRMAPRQVITRSVLGYLPSVLLSGHPDLNPTGQNTTLGNDGMRSFRDLRFPSFTRQVANRSWHPFAQISGVSAIIKGSVMKKRWHQSVSGTVGAI
jgi:hypothetical protein